ncbi:ParB/RepB/Spo0J family partition protein [Arthrobacter sp. L77]|uniref:ParB/RepB/Spo0J family partition protein n=1 Tax=Arthrobacter sp. L77 TaxID=1496689 RepID=UPI0005B821A0|nr:ParB/RepB/Spo0J family partition protein [Arthrobacter sp. L77]
MAEKRRGLGRGLGALIPSAPAEEIPETIEREREPEKRAARESDNAPMSRKQGGRPVDLFFERVTEDDVAEQPRSYSSALRSGINKNVLDAQTKRVAKGSSRKPTSTSESSRGAKSPVKEDSAAPDAAENAAHAVEDAPGPGSTADLDPALQVLPSGEDTTDGRPSDGIDARRDSTEETATLPDRQGAVISPPAADDTTAAPASATQDSSVGVSRETSEKTAPAPTPATGEALSQGELVDVPGATFADLALDSIHPNRKQPRTEFNADELAELVHSIREIGVLQPVVVRPSKEVGDAPYELVMGERRLRASREAGMETIPAIIRSTLDDDLLRDALLENLHRSALNPLEEAAAYQQLLDDFGCSHDELAGRLGRSRPQISNTLRLMKLPPLVQRRVAAGILSAGHARALLGLADPADMEKLAQRIVAEGLSVRSTEEIVALSGGLRRASKPSTPRDGARHERLDYLATSLSDRLDTNVKITLGAKKGRVSIEFASVDDLNRIIGVLSPTND